MKDDVVKAIEATTGHVLAEDVDEGDDTTCYFDYCSLCHKETLCVYCVTDPIKHIEFMGMCPGAGA